jgi:histidine ammonia-lyase
MRWREDDTERFSRTAPHSFDEMAEQEEREDKPTRGATEKRRYSYAVDEARVILS